MSPTLLGQLLVVGLATGAIYALVALGYSIIFSTTRILNFAQGEFLMIGALVGYTLWVSWGFPLPLALLLLLPLMALIGALSEKLIMVPVRLSGSRYAWIIATLGVSIVLRNLMVIPYGRESYPFPPLVAAPPWRLGGVVVEPQQVVILLTALALMVGFELFLNRTSTGRALRATAHSPDVASLMGVNVPAMVTLTFILSAMVTGIAGVLVAPVTTADANMGLLLGIKGFVAVILGGMGSTKGAAAGGLAIGVLESVVRGVLPASLGNIAVFAVLAVILLVRPSGLFGKAILH
ncbi:MAG: branched-chain amino acid ABC transporter permease [Dehalococcoidia bacterium]|nr:MAG: branched-chain amino acid ABC transporter permease [Dehalococcoidia bacterium]